MDFYRFCNELTKRKARAINCLGDEAAQAFVVLEDDIQTWSYGHSSEPPPVPDAAEFLAPLDEVLDDLQPLMTDEDARRAVHMLYQGVRPVEQYFFGLLHPPCQSCGGLGFVEFEYGASTPASHASYRIGRAPCHECKEEVTVPCHVCGGAGVAGRRLFLFKQKCSQCQATGKVKKWVDKKGWKMSHRE